MRRTRVTRLAVLLSTTFSLVATSASAQAAPGESQSSGTTAGAVPSNPADNVPTSKRLEDYRLSGRQVFLGAGYNF